MARKVTRHDMKHDEFVSTVGRITIWAEENLMTLVWAAMGLLVTVALGYGVWAWREHRQIQGETALSAVEQAFTADVGEVAVGGAETFPSEREKYQAVVERADEVIREHGSTAAGERARYYRGLALFESGQLVEAREALEAFVARDPDHFLAPLARRKIAETYEQEGDLEAACERYRDLTTVSAPEFPTELAYLDLGRCLFARGERDGAAEAYRSLLDEFPDSAYAGEARNKLLDIEPGL